MKIIIYWEQESWGGVDSHLLSLLKSWPNHKDHFLLITNKFNDGYLRIKNDLVSIPQLSCLEINGFSFNQISYKLRKLPFLGKWVARFLYIFHPLIFIISIFYLWLKLLPYKKYDVLMSNNGAYPGAFGCLSVLFSAKLNKIPVIILLIHHSASHLNSFFTYFETLLDRFIGQAVNHIICVSHATKKTILDRRRFNEEQTNFRVIHNGIGVSSIVNSQIVNLRTLVSIGQSEKLVGIMGRVEPYKGHEDLFFALARLNTAQKKQLKVIIIGSGDKIFIRYLNKLATKLKIESQVIFVGYLPGESSQLVAQLDLLLMLTKTFEGFGLTLVEAIRHSVPLIATRVGAIEEFVIESSGMIIEPGLPAEISRALISFLDNEQIWKKNAQLSERKKIFSSEEMAFEYRTIFSESLCSKSAKS
jgi:glycosyltransferase involved in cell wall biosynthesis